MKYFLTDITQFIDISGHISVKIYDTFWLKMTVLNNTNFVVEWDILHLNLNEQWWPAKPQFISNRMIILYLQCVSMPTCNHVSYLPQDWERIPRQAHHIYSVHI
jgi:hypothetical protein